MVEKPSKVIAVVLQGGADGIGVETPRVLFSASFQTGIAPVDVTPDGNRFLLTVNPPALSVTERLTVLTNWLATLAQ